MIYTMKTLRSRSATAENRDALPGRGGMSGGGVKGSPAIKDFRAGTTETLLAAEGPGVVRRMWMTSHAREPQHMRNLILRMYWDGCAVPSVEAPLGDFFGVAHGASVPMYAKYVSMQEGRGLNCFIPMPFAASARITVTNESDTDIDWFFYQIDFTLGDEVTEEHGRFHASFRRDNPCPLGRDFTIADVRGARGVFLGCVIGVRPLTPGWWGEGEVKLYLDDDGDYPTLCGTGMEDYVGSAWGLGEICTPTQGAPLVRGGFASLYRFHDADPIFFQQRLTVTVQQMGCGMKQELAAQYGDRLIFQPKLHPRRDPEDGFYLRSDDLCATSYWYQYPLAQSREPLPGKSERSADLFAGAAAAETSGTADEAPL
ncbi:glycoside hydrolase family 172 protein [Paenibacillus cymbidii]|uniref:glycoside hydrolase family 172 protein n=1 Tax=Paenibacillus cymbidii TaxID=1639034 RepID=UPI0010801B7F|nr:glycoside hydrolase family 172 protein [Paenibacillus cymbidii]